MDEAICSSISGDCKLSGANSYCDWAFGECFTQSGGSQCPPD